MEKSETLILWPLESYSQLSITSALMMWPHSWYAFDSTGVPWCGVCGERFWAPLDI